ncbi:MAG TPA: RING finger protein [Tepidisphaeraceae bacterium]|jgi:hypothetical protein|nr:RING finger protein [Tepidisphaeraceae bacterium]HEV8607314.1 RING finger protein [Tepidisphaeraceae bacterium]
MESTQPANVKPKRVPGQLCPICQSRIAASDAATFCPECRTIYHADCWEENQGCAVYGCSQVPAKEQKSNLEIPVSYWGQQHKPCPVCGQQIQAVALRCRHCGATFESARPEETGEFFQRLTLERSAHSAKTKVIWVFILCALPITAPIAGFVALIWYLSKRDAVNKMPAMYSAMVKIAVCVGLGQTVVVILIALLFSIFGGHG